MYADTTRMPLFPLNLVLLPGGVQSLQIFEPRYLDMVSCCLRKQSGFVIALIEHGDETAPDPEIFPTGVEVEISDWGQGENGLLNIVVRAVAKVTVVMNWSRDDHLMMGEIRRLPPEPERDLPPEFASMAEMLGRTLKQLGKPYDEDTRLGDASWVSGRLVELLPLKLERKQELLELDDPLGRLFMLRDDMLNLDII